MDRIENGCIHNVSEKVFVATGGMSVQEDL